MSDWRLPLFDLRFDAADRAAVDRVLDGGWLTMGPETEAFEQEAAAFLGVPHAILVTSGTAAIQLALMALAAAPRRPVIVPAITFAATANVPALAGHPILFADIASVERPTLCPDHLARLLRDAPDAIVLPVHYAGTEAAGCAEVVARHGGADLIEDAAHAFGGFEAGGGALGSAHTARAAGCSRALAAHSFFSNKNLAVGEGGLLAMHDDDLARRARLLRSHGLTRLTWARHRAAAPAASEGGGTTAAAVAGAAAALGGSAGGPAGGVPSREPLYDVVEPGLNLRPTEIVAALARTRLAKVAAMAVRRRALLGAYRRALAPAGVRLPFEPAEDARSAGHLAAAIFPDPRAAAVARAALEAARIQTSHHYTPLHRVAAYASGAWSGGGGAPPSLPRAEEFAARELTLPLFPEMGEGAVAEVADVVRRALGA